MTDPRPDDAPATGPDAFDAPIERPALDSVEQPDGVDADTDAADASSDADLAPDDDDATPAPRAGGRPPLVVLISAALLLMAAGAGLAILLVPAGRPAPQATAVAQPSAAAVAPAATEAIGATGPISGTENPIQPTALPLPEAIGDVDSTDVIATVGAVNITRGEFVRAYQPGAPALDVLNQLVQVELVLQQAAVEGVTVDPARVDSQLDEIKQANAEGDETKFLAFLQQNKIDSVDQLRTLLGRDQVVEQMLLVHTTLEQARARHILLAATGDQIAARKAEAEALLKQLQDGGDFAQIAGEKSEDPGSKETGGDLGWAPRGVFVPEFDEAIFSMKKDELRLVQSQFGWHIIQLIDLPQLRGLESRDMLNTPAGQQAFSETFLPWVEKLKTDAEAAQKIKILVTDAELVTLPGA